ncbi:hypothetical protein ACEWY4_026504 [Coilia grayii]|uniref:Reverse transcriptase domain-containing protein n=1 Tax=Coilia grayii TaxID=363190 RepID=A0ABD1IW21_9TELE
MEEQGVINLSKQFVPTQNQLAVLKKGLSFVPVPNWDSNSKKQLRADLQVYHRRLLLTAFFESREDTEQTPFTPQSKWTPKLSQVPPPVRKIIRADKYAFQNLHWEQKDLPNLSIGEMQALKQLKGNKQIIIKPADKGSAVVIMDIQQYIWEAERQLNNPDHYIKLDKPIYLDTIPQVQNILMSLKEKGFLNQKQVHYLIGKDKPRPRYFYLLPKIHKAPGSWSRPYEIPPGRPIVSDCSSETYGTAEYVEYFLNPISTRHRSYLKDTYDFIQKIRELKLPSHCFLFTMDIDSLYTNIETQAGLEAVKDWLKRYPDPKRPDSLLLQLLEINLTKNDFEFNGQFYLQIKGTAMGKRFAPSYANIYMAQWEEAALRSCPIKPLHYYRFLDDIWGVWSGTEQEFTKFADHLNNFHRSIKIKSTLHNSEVNFLDTVTYKGPDFEDTGRLDVRVYFKDTDTHSLLHKKSFHPRHTFRGIIKSQLLRFHRICTRKGSFWEATKVLFHALRKRGYSRSFLRKACKTFLCETPQDSRQLVPFVTTFSHSSTLLHKMTRDNFLKFVERQTVLQNHRIIAAHRKNPNLKDILVRSRLSPPNRPKTPFTTSEYLPKQWVSNRQSKQLFKIWPEVSFGSLNCVYLIYCQKCNIQYVGETRNTIATRLIQHKYNIRKKKETHTHIVQHFISHGLHSLRVMGLEQNEMWTTFTRKRTERNWIKKLGTEHPWGLNEK